jgi:hypothetical protein
VTAADIDRLNATPLHKWRTVLYLQFIKSVRKNTPYIALLYFVTVSLLFNQVGINFFHNKHNAHESYQVQSDQAQYHSHGEHCKVCSIDTLFHLFFQSSLEFHFQQPETVAITLPVLGQVNSSDAFIQGRAPPVI